jgi:hypothetical protein
MHYKLTLLFITCLDYYCRFPSLESHMSVVILGHFCMFYNFILVFPFAVAVTFVIGVSRVYSRSRFPHQIVGSWLTGLLGLVKTSMRVL